MICDISCEITSETLAYRDDTSQRFETIVNIALMLGLPMHYMQRIEWKKKTQLHATQSVLPPPDPNGGDALFGTKRRG